MTPLLVLLGCARQPVPVPVPVLTATEVVPGLLVEPLAKGVWRFSSGDQARGAVVPVNGLLVRDSREASLLMVDAPRDGAQVDALLAWAEATLHQSIGAAVVTRADVEHLGGGMALWGHGVSLFGHPRAARVAAAAPVRPIHTLEAEDAVYLGAVELFYPGPGQRPDGVVAWLPESSVLYAGDLVRPADARDLGDTQLADPVSWSIALDRIIRRYPDAVQVVPGRGDPGDLSLLVHTRALLALPSRAPAPELTATHREACARWDRPGDRPEPLGVDDVAGTGADRVEVWTVDGGDLGRPLARGMPLRHDLAFHHAGGWLVCADSLPAISPSVLQETRHCEPLPEESDVWWWCPEP